MTTRPTDRGHQAGTIEFRAEVGGRARSFGGRTVRTDAGGALAEPLGRVPGAMAALHTGRARPRLPSVVSFVADDGYDRVELDASLVHAAQIVVAEPVRPGYGFIHELLGTFRYRARIGGVEAEGEGLAAFERVD
ncbi:MAG: hypothetical protein M3327_08215 [Actinomycetota bacterium]|nr:hypothetical protein [Actinomycetota bacterium]